MKKIAITILLSTILLSANAVDLEEIQFNNQKITDILLALANLTEVSIVPDATVTGNATYFFSKMNFDEALALFVKSHDLYFWKEGPIYYVSKIRVVRENDLYTVDAENVNIELLVKGISRRGGTTILSDSLPRENISIHASRLALKDVLEIITARFPDYELIIEDNYYYIKRVPASRDNGGGPSGRADRVLSFSEIDGYSIKADRINLKPLLIELFNQQGVEFSFMNRNDAVLENLYYSKKSFEDMLRLILEHGVADYTVGSNGVYYILEARKEDVLKKLTEVKIVPLQYLNIQDLVSLLPSEFNNSRFVKFDKATNAVILTGTTEETAPVYSYITEIDKPTDGRKYYRFNLQYTKPEVLVGLLPNEFMSSKPISLAESNSIILRLTPVQHREAIDFISTIDKKDSATPIRLLYLKSDEIMDKLPPSVSADDIQISAGSPYIFFKGSKEKLDDFRRELELIDQPTPQIRYDLLVIQYQESDSYNVNSNIQTFDDQGMISDAIKGTIDINFDLVSTLGLEFAQNISFGLTNNNTRVWADTSLFGLSGEEIKFQNTSTSRYKDTEIDVDSGDTTSRGIIREFSSGLTVDLTGWVSGDGMVTVEISASTSKQVDTATSGEQDSLPVTTEKKINTSVRTYSGKPITIGGLIQEDTIYTKSGIPILSDIPFLGFLFSDVKESTETSEIIIYLIPHVEPVAKTPELLSRDFDDMYYQFVEGF